MCQKLSPFVSADTAEDVSPGAPGEINFFSINGFQEGASWLAVCYFFPIMQIPYDLEFVENRAPVATRVVALPGHFPAWRSERPREQQDAFDALLAWIHRMLRRFENS
ncbi:MAG: hypothetical protein ABI968_01910 [Acidobacteriota bacterium]